jgi:hypothetical protein
MFLYALLINFIAKQRVLITGQNLLMHGHASITETNKFIA